MRKSFTADFKAKVALQAIKGDRSVTELAAKFEVHPNQIRQWKKSMLEGLPDIFSDKRKKKVVKDEDEKAKLYEQIGRLKIENDWLKKNLTNSSVEEKRSMIEPNKSKLSICRQCELLEISRSAYYYKSHAEDEQDFKIRKMIDELFTKHPFKGSRTITDDLKDAGLDIGRHKVRRLMREMGLQAIYPKKRFNAKNKGHTVYPYLLRDMEINKVDQVWVSDITYIPLRYGNAYLTAVMDWHSRYVISWELSMAMDSSFCVNALSNALEDSKPLIFNTDQGSQYTINSFTEVLKENRIWISMSGKGRAFDNIMIERLWRTVKYEEVYLTEYENYFAAYDSLEKYFEYYNNERRHSSLSKRTPSEVYFTERNKNIDVA